MSRAVVLTALVLTVLFTACMAAVRAQPYDDEALRSFFQAIDGCKRPCFLGIQAGVTSGAEAIDILEHHEWIDPDTIVQSRDEIYQFIWVSWQWSGRQPDFLNGLAYLTFSNLTDGRIATLRVNTGFSLGDLWLSLGPPQIGGVDRFQHIGYFADERLLITNRMVCHGYWQEPTTVFLVAEPSVEGFRSLYRLEPYAETVAERLELCRGR
ncbi:MAG: hypothetical protein JNM70_01605 [Anaerolineae bacterium]|nr:hypothetical protein [Anaerolineae bacterium]